MSITQQSLHLQKHRLTGNPFALLLKQQEQAMQVSPRVCPAPSPGSASGQWQIPQKNYKKHKSYRNTSLHVFQHSVICSSETCWISADISMCNSPHWIFQLRNQHYFHEPSFSPHCLFLTGEYDIVQNLPYRVAYTQGIKPALPPSLRLIKLQ